jgi:RNA polymerase sigma factor (sigma-70 family)
MDFTSGQEVPGKPSLYQSNCTQKLQTSIYAFTRSYYTNPEDNFWQLGYCLETEMRNMFVATASVRLKQNSPDEGYAKFISDSAFTEAILVFKEKLKIDSWTDNGASVKTYFSRICWMKIKELTKKEKRLRDKHAGLAIVYNGTENTNGLETKTHQEITYKMLAEAMKQLTPRDAKLVELRYGLGLPPREIAKAIGGDVEKITRELFNAMEELRKIFKVK